MKLEDEFDRQVQNLVQKNYPEMAGVSVEKFIHLINPLRDQLDEIEDFEVDLEKGLLPFVIVVSSVLVPIEKTMSMVLREGKIGITKLFPHTSADFDTIDSVKIPDSKVYLLVGIDRGRENINLPPSEAMKIITDKKRSPLTIDEGVAIVTHYPEYLMKNNCFSLLASRHVGDQRVPAIWINANKQPNLGWCWDGNPHTWLGSASCKTRVG